MASLHRPLAAIDADIADVRDNLNKARAATSYGFGGRNLSRSYESLRGELRDLLEEKRALVHAARGAVRMIPTRRGH
jgi:hypothetical protein